MILVKIKHYLRPTGLEYFSMWFEDLTEHLIKKEGFIDIGHLINRKEGVCNIILFFDNNKNLNEWAKSTEHNQIISKLDQYRAKPWTSKRYNIISYEMDEL